MKKRGFGTELASRLWRQFKYLLITLMVLQVCTTCSEKEDITLNEDQWSFLVFGDIRMGMGIYSKLVHNMASVTPDPVLAICGGDVMNHGSNEIEWTAFWEYSLPITQKMELHITRGNHEGNTEGDERIFRQQLKTSREKFYYSFRHETTQFIILDTEIRGEERGIYNEQLDWLIEQLEDANRDPFIENVFLSLHRPLYPQGGHYGGNLGNAHELHDLFLEYDKIKAVLVSHDHVYNRYDRDGIIYITSGGGGAPLYRGRGGDFHHFLLISIHNQSNRINVKTIGLYNEVIEDFDL